MPDDHSLLVALCTHNPNRGFLAETIDALARQTMAKEAWEFLLVDNASTTTTARDADISWHPRARCISEPKPGLTAARSRVIREAVTTGAKTILFVDDDNILAPDFLERGLALGRENPRLGCWGGQLIPRFEEEPPEWFKAFKKYLALFDLEEDIVSEAFKGNHDILPAGAGMFLKTELATRYIESMALHPLRRLLGVNGKDPMRGEDTDIGLFALAEGWQVARFRDLILTHITPSVRITMDYVARVLEGAACSDVLLRSIHGEPLPKRDGWITRLRRYWQARRLPDPHGRFYAAECRGRHRGFSILTREGVHSFRLKI
ncbi:MAG: glycosyltransferase [Verrucomicrobia bacterium]|jgi:glycosyltransferase involved in cell wall biosynthesis|nr:glycosyltransferase [Verrucomicrobiota bacterium]